MKIQIALLAALSFAAAQPLFAGDDDSLTEKAIRLLFSSSPAL